MSKPSKLHSKFKLGLSSKYSLTEEDLKEYIEDVKRREILDIQDLCVCGHKINNVRYLMHRDGIKSDIDNIKIGNCCIRQFIDKEQRGKHCDICKAKHNNRLDNLCKNCRILCIECHKNKKAVNKDICFHCINDKWQKELKVRKLHNNKPLITIDSTMTITEYDLDL